MGFVEVLFWVAIGYVAVVGTLLAMAWRANSADAWAMLDDDSNDIEFHRAWRGEE